MRGSGWNECEKSVPLFLQQSGMQRRVAEGGTRVADEWCASVRASVRPSVRPENNCFLSKRIGGVARVLLSTGSLNFNFEESKSGSLVNEVKSWYQPVQGPLFGP